MKNERHFISTDGRTNIRYNVWQGEQATDGIFLIVHGVAEHIDRYDELAETMTKNGYICYGCDNLGHGKSGEIGKVPMNAEVYFVDDIKKLYDLATAEHPDLPVFLFGHSMGSCISRVLIQKYDLNLKGLILCGTGHLPSIARVVIPAFKKQQSSEKLVKNSVPLSWLSFDKDNQEAYANDPLVAHKTTQGFQSSANLVVAASCKKGWANRLSKWTPVLVISGIGDPYGVFGYGPKRAGRDLKKSGIYDVTVKIYKNAKHEILNEGEVKQTVLSDIINWVTSRNN